MTQKRISQLILACLLVLGVYFRFYHLNWDEGHWFHPDERNIAMAVSRIQFPLHLNPEFFAYNGLWFYLVRLVGDFYHIFPKNLNWASSWEEVNTVSRFLSAVFSSLTLLFIYKVTKKLLHEKAALVALALSACTVGFIQYAHYGVTESVLAFYVVFLTWLCLIKKWYLTALVSGLAVGTKTSAASFLIIPFLFYLITEKFKLMRTINLLLIFCLTVFISTPYSFLSWNKFKESMAYESGVVSGRLQVPYNLSFLNTKPYLYSFQNLFWHLGPLLPLFGFLGLIYLPFPVLAFILAYFLYIGAWYTKFIRYLIPIYPVLIIAATLFLFQFKKHFSKLGLSLIYFSLFFTFLWATAYLNIFKQESTRITASKWIYQNLPAGSTILTEHWDDRVPIGLAGFTDDFKYVELTNYEPDSLSKINDLSNKLANADYVVMASRRLSGSIGNATQKYPFTSHYYQLMDEQKLGYQLVKRFSVYPQLGSFVINDDFAEETFQVYDHPVARVFQNVSRLDQAKIKALILEK